MARGDVKVSVVIPVYNAGQLLGRMLVSILAQTEQSFEVICVDDGSNDNGATAAILEKYAALDARITVLKQKNLGSIAARNAGLEKVCGKYAYSCDQDDWLHPQLFEYCVWTAETNDVPFVAFRYDRCEGNMPPTVPRLNDFGKVPLLVVDERTSQSNPAAYRRAHCFHTDCWVQFTTLDLARTFPFILGRGVTRPYTLLKTAKRWAVSEAVLYYYNPGVATSMMHKPISKKVLLAEREDWIAFWNLYKDERKNGDASGLWRHQCKNMLVKGLKIELNAIRRSRKQEDPSLHRQKLEILSETLREFFIRRKLPLRYASFRHAIKYLWLMMRFRSRECQILHNQ